MAAPSIICTIGPSSNKPEILKHFSERGVMWHRINLSHTDIEHIETRIKELQPFPVPVCLDTEGCQIRTGQLGSTELELTAGASIEIYDHPVPCSRNRIFLRPLEVIFRLEPRDNILIDFNSVRIRVDDIDDLPEEGFIRGHIVQGGVIGNNKGVHILDRKVSMPPFSQKDIEAIRIAKNMNVNHFTLSFVSHPRVPRQFRAMHPQATFLSKIETALGVDNADGIIAESDGILIDRGDMSREVYKEDIPRVQDMLIAKCNAAGKPIFIATHILDSMFNSSEPDPEEIMLINHALQRGATGVVLTKESAIGRYPKEAVDVLSRLSGSLKPQGVSIL